MSDLSASQGSSRDDSVQMPIVIYVLYLVGFFTIITPVVGLILAYVSKSRPTTWLDSHYDNAIHVFWKGILYMILSVVIICLSIPFFVQEQILPGVLVALIGALASLGQLVWYIVRCVKGIMIASDRRAYPDPESWGF
ncbi:hypothetical protein FF098_005880 [Parvularcula flava]|uniref:Membrane protein n=1 Tax=Aquisalinus luteolus TaxID=1566827 RepID=A0A8J3EQV9_9PROT|nr:hypothetical protein [Aquisalinus luteolus]NHK27429.1 hypothetical protein [Aquisalinus luteolus]GGH95411.1 membrane protein [Aquisalinus luteolus]